MGEILKLILPILLQLLPQLFNKPKAKMVEWFQDGAKAAVAQKLPFNAWALSSAACAFDGMDNGQYEDVKFSVTSKAEAIRAAVAAERAEEAKGGAA